MLSRTEASIVGLIEGKLPELSHGELHAHILREEIKEIKISFEYERDEHGCLAAAVMGSEGVISPIRPVYEITFNDKKK